MAYEQIGLKGVIVIDIITFLFAIGTLLIVVIPSPEKMDEKIDAKVSISDDMRKFQ